MEEMKNIAETYKICGSSETHTSQNISCMSVAEIFANFKSKTGNILLIFISIKHMDINIPVIHNL
jgi:hypothetical protein